VLSGGGNPLYPSVQCFSVLADDETPWIHQFSVCLHLQVVGLAFQCLTVGENIGYVIPVSSY
jgi:hypothetical protein